MSSCTGPLRSAFLARLKERTEAILLGDPQDEATQMGPLVSFAQREKVLAYIEKGKAEGARLVTGGGIPNTISGEGFYVQPTVFADVTDEMAIAREEIFGPVMCVPGFRRRGRGRGPRQCHRIRAGRRRLYCRHFPRPPGGGPAEAGTLWINTYNLCPVEIPFGGSKQSGFGRENSAAALEHYSELKTVYVGMGRCEAPY